LKEKGFDGLFVDNLDVYYLYPSEENFEAITYILKAFKEYGFYVTINGGDEYVKECLERFETTDDLFDAVNQETVFSRIIWDEEDTFGTQETSEREYFTEYLGEVSKRGIDVYLLEYTTDDKLIQEIESFCKERGYYYYVSPKLNLEAE
jgi:Predicted extracellular endo alpha-1,4 polygalactosaminidase or related polysaccharide hydrolase